MGMSTAAPAMRRVDAGAAIRYGWDVTKANLSLIIVLVIIAALATGIPSGIAESLEQPAPALSALFRLASSILSIVVSIGALRISLRLHDGQEVALRDLYAVDWSIFWRYAVATILYSLIVAVGLVLFVIPGIILGMRYLLFGYFVVEKGSRPVDALAQSSAATDGARWDLFVFVLALLLLNILSALALVVGLLITIPISFLASARVYRTLTSSPA